MTRPTEAEVDEAIARLTDQELPWTEDPDGPRVMDHVDAVVGEVIALRLEAENASAEHRAACDELKEARAELLQLRVKVSRCESTQKMYAALAKSWGSSKDPHSELFTKTYEFVAGELESCLRSVP